MRPNGCGRISQMIVQVTSQSGLSGSTMREPAHEGHDSGMMADSLHAGHLGLRVECCRRAPERGRLDGSLTHCQCRLNFDPPSEKTSK